MFSPVTANFTAFNPPRIFFSWNIRKYPEIGKKLKKKKLNDCWWPHQEISGSGEPPGELRPFNAFYSKDSAQNFVSGNIMGFFPSFALKTDPKSKKGSKKKKKN